MPDTSPSTSDAIETAPSGERMERTTQAEHRDVRIDRSSPVPFYYQLRQILEAEIGSERIGAGDRLPSEAELCERFGVSRTVVRQTLSDLENESLIVRFKGRGSFVAGPKTAEHLVQSLTSLQEDVRARGQKLETRVLRLETEPVSPYVADVLKLAPGTEIVLLERLRIVDGVPWQLTTAYLPYSLCSPVLDLDMSQVSLYEALERHLGLELHRGRRSVEAGLADRIVAEHLAIQENDPILILRGSTYLADGRPIEHFVGIHRGDRSRFDVELYRPLGPGQALETAAVLTEKADSEAPALQSDQR
jgi:GntR family transcriptional regulator